MSSTTAGAVPAESTSFTTHYGRMASTAALYQAAAEPSSRVAAVRKSPSRSSTTTNRRSDRNRHTDRPTDRQTGAVRHSSWAYGWSYRFISAQCPGGTSSIHRAVPRPPTTPEPVLSVSCRTHCPGTSITLRATSTIKCERQMCQNTENADGRSFTELN